MIDRSVLSCLLAAAVLLPAAARAGQERADLGEFSDEALQRRASGLEQSLKEVQHEIDAEYSETLKLESRLKQERVEFERGLLERRKAFLQSLRALPSQRRPEAYRLFRLAEDQRRREFLLKQQERRDRFDSDDERRARKRRRETVQDYEDTRKQAGHSDIQEA